MKDIQEFDVAISGARLLMHNGRLFRPKGEGIYVRADDQGKVRRADNMRRSNHRKLHRIESILDSVDVEALTEKERLSFLVAKDKVGETLLTMKALSRKRKLPPGL